jgi:hypothetical protein
LVKKSRDGDNEDPSLSGRYLIIASRQIIGYDKHETIIEIATTSSDNQFIPVSNPLQTSAIGFLLIWKKKQSQKFAGKDGFRLVDWYCRR